MIVTFVIFLVAFAAIGLWSARYANDSPADYFLASSGVRPWLVGLSAAATCNSGYMFIGLIGYTYATGLAAMWLLIGFVGGDYLASLYVHKRLRHATDVSGELSYAGVLAHWGGGLMPKLQKTIGAIALVFLIAYATAQLVASGKTLLSLLDWPVWLGASISAVVVASYCVGGGIRASVWTDAAQSTVMIIAMAVVLAAALAGVGGIGAAFEAMRDIPGYLSFFPRETIATGLLGGALFAVGWLFAGLSAIGQPHIMVRFMMLDDTGNMRRARLWYYLWYLVFFALAITVGLLSRVYLGRDANFDAELALPTLAQQLLPPVLVGFVLAAIIAASMSTADSLVLSCSAALSHDLLPPKAEKTKALRLATLAIVALALTMALSNNQSVFDIVILAWSGLASAFAPLLLVRCMGHRPREITALIALPAGLLTALLWRWQGWHELIFEGLPGIVVGLAVYAIGWLASKYPKPESRNKTLAAEQE